MKRSPRLTVLATVTHNLELLPYFFRHYERLRVDRFILNFEFTNGVDTRPTCEEIASREGVSFEVGTIRIGPHCSETQPVNVNRTWHEKDLADDWVLFPDLDEFFEFPTDLPTLIDDLDVEIVTGEILDRVAANGELPRIDPDRRLEEQFSLGCHMTRDVLKAPAHNVVLSRNHCPTLKHYDKCETSPTRPTRFRVATIHHFKWNARAVPMLRERMALYRAWEYEWWIESAAFLDWFDERGGRLDLSELQATPVPQSIGI